MFSTVTGNDWTTFIMGPVRGPPWHFPMVLDCLIYLSLTYIHWSNVGLCHTSYIHLKAESSYSAIPRGGIIPRNMLSTIPSHMSHCTTIKAFGILMTSPTIGNCFSYLHFNTIVKCLDIHCMQDHSPMGGDLIFKGQRIHFHSMLAFYKPKTHLLYI